LEGEGPWDIQKETLGWVFDGVKRCIEIPFKKLKAITSELCSILRLQYIPCKSFEKIVGKLRHSTIGLPVGRGLCAPFSRTISVHPAKVSLGKDGLVRAVFQDWLQLLADMCSRFSHVNELIGQPISDVGNINDSCIGAGGVWMSMDSSYPPAVWRVEWLVDISKRVVSDRNPKRSFTNSDLKMAAILLQ